MFNSLDDSRVKAIHLRITALSSAGYFLDGFDISIVSVAILILVTEFHLGAEEELLLIGSTLIGMIFGGVLGGYFTDRNGRKSLYLWDMMFFVIFTILTAVSTTYMELLLFRLLLGVAIGADYAISPTIIAEYAPAKSRGRLLTVSGVTWFIGAAFSYLMGYVFLPLGAESWRYMFLIGIIPAIIVLVMRASVPETPRWLASQGKIAEAKESIEKVVTGESIAGTAKQEKVSLKMLFSKRFIAATVFISIFWFILDAVTYVIALDGPTILVTLGLTSSRASFTAAVIAIIAIFGGVLTFFFIDVAGRKIITAIGFLGMALTLLVAGFILRGPPDIIAIVALFIGFEIMQEMGPGITNSIYPQELYPTSIRATAQGFGTTISRIGAVIGIFTFGFIAAPFGYGVGMIFLAVLSVTGLAVTLIFGKETKGKSLEALAETK